MLSIVYNLNKAANILGLLLSSVDFHKIKTYVCINPLISNFVFVMIHINIQTDLYSLQISPQFITINSRNHITI